MMDIEKLAREAGLTVVATLDCDPPYSMYSAEDASLRRFAALVAEECAKMAEHMGLVAADMYGDGAECLNTADLCATAIRERFKAF